MRKYKNQLKINFDFSPASKNLDGLWVSIGPALWIGHLHHLKWRYTPNHPQKDHLSIESRGFAMFWGSSTLRTPQLVSKPIQQPYFRPVVLSHVSALPWIPTLPTLEMIGFRIPTSCVFCFYLGTCEWDVFLTMTIRTIHCQVQMVQVLGNGCWVPMESPEKSTQSRNRWRMRF